jgi:hypothetical protein
MAKPGDWGGGGAAVPRIVKRTQNVVKNTITEPEAEDAQGPAPKLKLYAEPQYQRGPFDPEFRRLQAKGSDDVEHGR